MSGIEVCYDVGNKIIIGIKAGYVNSLPCVGGKGGESKLQY